MQIFSNDQQKRIGHLCIFIDAQFNIKEIIISSKRLYKLPLEAFYEQLLVHGLFKDLAKTT